MSSAAGTIPPVLAPLFLLAFLAAVAASSAPAARAEERPALRYTIVADISSDSASITGTVQVELRNESSKAPSATCRW